MNNVSAQGCGGDRETNHNDGTAFRYEGPRADASVCVAIDIVEIGGRFMVLA